MGQEASSFLFAAQSVDRAAQRSSAQLSRNESQCERVSQDARVHACDLDKRRRRFRPWRAEASSVRQESKGREGLVFVGRLRRQLGLVEEAHAPVEKRLAVCEETST